jgi:glutathione S-transferase
MAARRMLELKGIPYARVDLMPVVSRGALKALRFPSNTVPSLAVEGKKITGSREIARELDRIRPEPPLYPTEPGPRAAVEGAERWGEEVLQPAVRRIVWNTLRRNRTPLATYAEGARLGVPIGLAVRTAAPIVAAAARMNAPTTRPSAPTSPPCRDGCSGSTTGSARVFSAPSRRARPTCRSERACGWR